MKLRSKITFLISIFTVLLITAIFILNEYFLMSSYQELQIKQKEASVKNVNVAIEEMLNRHSLILKDWSNWDATLGYISGTNPTFIKDELVDKVLLDQKINYVLIYDKNMDLVLAKGFDYINQKSLSVSSDLVNISKNYINMNGVLEVDGKSIVFSSATIKNSSGSGRGDGLIVFAHEIDESCIDGLSIRTGYDLTFKKKVNAIDDILEIESKKLYSISINKKYLNSENATSISFEMPKEIEMLGVKNAVRLHIYSVITIAFLGLFIRQIIVRFVHRLEKINKDVSSIRSLSDTNYRIEVKGKDELSELSLAINNMLDKILLMNNKLVESATFDLLTGVYNRRTGLEKLEKNIRTNKRVDDLTISFIDINDLKQVNDDHGHRFGDEYIKKVTEVLIRNIRDKDFVCRLGGDEFLIVFKGCCKEDAKRIMDRINRDLSKINSQKIYKFNMSISSGIVSYTEGLDIDDFVEMADKRMYVDKTRYKKKINQANKSE